MSSFNGLFPFFEPKSQVNGSHIDYVICETCNKNPSLEFEKICIVCRPNNDINNKCYNCDKCIKTRKYLEDTSSQFGLCGYRFKNGTNTEVWHCSGCMYYMEFYQMVPSIIRDLIHEQARKNHIENECALLKSGEVMIQ